MAEILIIQASPRTSGISAFIAQNLFDKLDAEQPDCSKEVINVSSLSIQGCIGCDYCATHMTCCFKDDMAFCITALNQAQCVFVVCPVYFSGPPSQFKAFLDRLQPLYWKRKKLLDAGLPLPEKRPAYLYISGGGHDPHGYKPLVTEITSAFALADFRISVVQTFIGLSDAGAFARGTLDSNRFEQTSAVTVFLPEGF